MAIHSLSRRGGPENLPPAIHRQQFTASKLPPAIYRHSNLPQTAIYRQQFTASNLPPQQFTATAIYRQQFTATAIYRESNLPPLQLTAGSNLAVVVFFKRYLHFLFIKQF